MPWGSKDFSAILTKVKTASPEVLGISSANLSDFIVFTRQMKEQNINVKMFGTTTAVAEFQKELGKVAEFAYGASPWEPSLPYPGVKEFVDAYQKSSTTRRAFTPQVRTPAASSSSRPHVRRAVWTPRSCANTC